MHDLDTELTSPPIKLRPFYAGAIVTRSNHDGFEAIPLQRPTICITTEPPMSAPAGRHFLQIPGPSNVPERVLRAIDAATIDHRGPDFAKLGQRVLDNIRKVFKTEGRVFIYPSSGTGAWEAALANTVAAGDRVLMYETGHFASLWHEMATRLGLDTQMLGGDWRHGVNAQAIEQQLQQDRGHQIKAVCVVHNETSTGVTSNIADVRRCIDSANHPALLLVDTISSLASMDYRHDEWGVDVTVCGSQKGLMLPPGLGFNAVSDKALAIAKHGGMPRSYWDWHAMIKPNDAGFFPYTPATNLIYGLDVALEMLLEEGLDNVFARHDRFAEATRRAVRAWGLDILCANPDEYSSVLTAVMMPKGHSADRLRTLILERFDMSLGTGLSKVADKVFRIGHLGDFNDLSLLGTLAGVQMGLQMAAVPCEGDGVRAAMEFLADRDALLAQGLLPRAAA